MQKLFSNNIAAHQKKIKNHYIAHPQSTKVDMENNFRNEQRTSYNIFRVTKDIVMSILFLGMAAIMFFPVQLKMVQLEALDELFRYLFGGICLLYGSFRLYRAIKKDY